MKIFQSYTQFMEGKKIFFHYYEFFPSEAYPNSELDGYHDFYEIEFFLSASGLHYINSIPFTVGEGYIFLVRPPDYHHYDLLPTSFVRRYHIKFMGDVLYPDVAENLDNSRHPYSTVLTGQLQTEMETEMEYLRSLMETEQPNELLLRNIVNRICILLYDALSSSVSAGTVLPQIPPNGDTRLRSLLDFIGENCLGSFTLADAARFMGLTESYFGNYFRKTTGLLFSEYVNRVRLHHGAELLRTTRMSVKEIAYHVGFHSPEYFSREFRKYFGKSPGKYKTDQSGSEEEK